MILFNSLSNIDPYAKYSKLLTKFKNADLPKNYATINLLTNMPIDEKLVNTPNSDITPSNKEYTSELSLLLLSSALNSCPYINEDEKSGRVIQNVIPIQGKEMEASGSGSTLTFNWHTENVHEEHPAEYLILLCLRGDKNAFTSFMLLEDILSGMEESMLNSLLITKFIMKTGPSYHKEKKFVRPILSKENGRFTITYNSDINRCSPLDDAGTKLYLEFQRYIDGSVPSYAISLCPGEAVIIKNREALHKRDGFTISTTNEERRWLQRVYLKNPKFLSSK
jgi:L-asparagine oxygenase